jgi:C-terminal processing protease CtpA/Prc
MRWLRLLGALALAAGCGKAAVGSIGAVLGRDPETGAVHVRAAPEGMAASEAGLLPDDEIKMIDGVVVDGLGKERVVAMLRGEIGTTVRLTVVRGEEVLHLEIKRGALRQGPAPQENEERLEP